MDIMSLGNINTYVKTMSMQQKWQRKIDSGDFSADGTKTLSEWAEKQKENNGNNKDTADWESKDDTALRTIKSKMSNGKKLSPSERQYLLEKDPQSYRRLTDIEAEQRLYEQELKRCRTKDDVRRLKMCRAACSLGTVNSVKNDPNISADKKMEIIAGEQQKMAAFEASTTEFVKSGKFGGLPTDAEKLEAEKIMKEAKDAELHRDKDNKIKTAPAKKHRTDKSDGKENERRKAEEKKAEAKESAAEKAEQDKKKRTRAKAKARAVYSPSVRKLKRSRTPYNSADFVPQPVPAKKETPSLDVKC